LVGVPVISHSGHFVQVIVIIGVIGVIRVIVGCQQRNFFGNILQSAHVEETKYESM
jgi:hypothetical protein